MNTIDDNTFRKLVKKEFSFLKNYGFRFSKLSLGAPITAIKRNIRVDFVREFGTLNMYIRIRLKGRLGRQASDIKKYRSLGLGQLMLLEENAIKEYHDKVKMDLRTPEDFVERFHQLKPQLIKCCDTLFRHNDLSHWHKIVEYTSKL